LIPLPQVDCQRLQQGLASHLRVPCRLSDLPATRAASLPATHTPLAPLTTSTTDMRSKPQRHLLLPG
jgi:hypothetical protein